MRNIALLLLLLSSCLLAGCEKETPKVSVSAGQDRDDEAQRIANHEIAVDPKWECRWDGRKRQWFDRKGNMVKWTNYDSKGRREWESDFFYSGRMYNHADGTDREKVIITTSLEKGVVTVFFAGDETRMRNIVSGLDEQPIGSEKVLKLREMINVDWLPE